MPYINSKVNFEVKKEQEEKLKTRLGATITIIPGKAEKSLMIGFESINMYFRGSDADKMAMIEVMLYGTADRGAMNDLTSEICNIYNEELGISKANIYIKYEEVEVWGCNGGNF